MTKQFLHVAQDFKLPVSAITSTLVVYGGKGMGKTNFGRVLAEEIHESGNRFSVIDPMGVWWGLQHGQHRTDPGISVLILGGIHGDLPINPDSAVVVADLVADESVSVVVDISRHANGTAWSKADKVRFVERYVTRLYERQVERRRPIMQIIDEAARYAPQRFGSGEMDVAKCAGAIQMICEEGRNIGIGMCLLTQRSARLNKDVAEIADAMIAFRIVGPNSVGAVLDWFGEHVEREKHKGFVDQLRKMPVGKALVVSPGWLQYEGAVQFRLAHTFDSSATPGAGKELAAPGKASKPDLAKYQERMKEVVEQAKANDPKVLRARIRELEDANTLAKAVAESETKMIARIKEQEARLDRFASGLATVRQNLDEIVKTCGAIKAYTDELVHYKPDRSDITKRSAAMGRGDEPLRDPKVVFKPINPPPNVMRTNGIGAPLKSGERLVLASILQYPDGITDDDIATLTGYKATMRATYVKTLRERGYITGDGRSSYRPTPAGFAALPDFEPLPTGKELRQFWYNRLQGGELKLYSVLDAAYPVKLNAEQIMNATGYKATMVATHLKELRVRRLLDTSERGVHRLSEKLFED